MFVDCTNYSRHMYMLCEQSVDFGVLNLAVHALTTQRQRVT